MIRWISEWRVAIIGVLATAALIALTILAAEADDRACRERGGHMVCNSATGMGVSSKGEVVPVIVTSCVCTR